MALLLTTTERVAALINNSKGSATVDASVEPQIDALIASVSAAIQGWLNRSLETAARTEYFDAEPGMRSIQLNAWPVSAITSIHYSSVWDFTDNYETLTTPEDYFLQANAGLVHLNQARTAAKQAFKVVYTAGIGADEDDVVADYPDIADAAEKQIVHEWRRRLNLEASTTQMQGASSTHTSAVQLLPSVKERLAQYRRAGWVI